MIFKIAMIILLIKINKINLGESFSKSSSIYSNQHSSSGIDSMKSYIKEILNISTSNDTIDEYVFNHFRINNPNPAYIFMLPDEHNRTLIFHQSDFKERNFPKRPTTNIFENKTFNIFNMLEALDMDSKILEQNNSAKLFDNDVNDHPENFTKNPMSSRSRKYESSKYTTNYDNWDELGLPGWSGEIRKPISEYKYTAERPPRTETLLFNINIKRPKTDSAQFHNLVKSSETNLQQSIKHQPKQNSTVRDLSEQLSEVLAKERKDNKQKFNKSSQIETVEIPKFPVTSSRDQHITEYVFVARANNPFGHSTKWQFNNSSKSNEIKNRKNRRKRGVLQLYSMIKCGTDCQPLIYKGYGCYCGFLGSGKAVNEIDRCCAKHDYCYTKSSCPMFLQYFVPYLWICYRGNPLCAIDHGEWGGPDSCSAQLCNCDRVLVKCLQQYNCPRSRAVCRSSSWRFF